MLARMRTIAAQIRGVFSKRAVDEDFTQELEAHQAMLTEENIARGMSPGEARRVARLRLGGAAQLRETHREQWGLPRMETFLQDLRYALRMLRKSPGFTAIAILTLALGIGANTAIFTLTYAVILKSLPVPNPQQLVRYTYRNGDQDLGLSGPLYDSLRKHETADQDIFAYSSTSVSVEENGTFTPVESALMSGNGFRVLELKPLLGRTFTEADDVSAGGPNGYQALLGNAYWSEHFHASADVVGHTLAVNGKTATIIGVLPAGFEGVVSGRRADIILPLAFEEVLNTAQPLRNYPGSFWLTVIGRLKPGESLRSAETNLLASEASIRADADPSKKFLAGFFAPFRIGVESGRSGRAFLKMQYGRPLIVLEILAGLLLLLCCANTALLVLARVSNRLRELAVRSALGAPRGRLFRQVLSEIALLAFCGLAGGIALGFAAARSLVSMLAAIGQPPPLDVVPQAAILAFTAAISAFSALAAGMWPALRASRISPMLGLKQNSASTFTKGLGTWIVPSQVAVSVALLAAASLLGGSFIHLLLEDSGFRTDGLVMADVDLSANKLAPAVTTRYALQLADALAEMPGVEAAAVMSTPPIHDWWSVGDYFSLGKDGTVHTDMTLWPEVVTSGYFAAIGTPILEGRSFSRSDASGGQLCVLSASAARYFFPEGDAVGKYVYSGDADQKTTGKLAPKPSDTFRVIGVAADARFRSLREDAPRMIYELAVEDEIGGEFFIVARGTSNGVTAGAIREASHRVVPAASPSVFTFDQLVATHLRRERMLMALSACFAGIALLLTMLGLYGVLSRSVVMRTKEIGLRLALGARPLDALALVLRQGLRLVLIGAIIGVAVALVVTRFLGSLLFGVSAMNPIVFAAVVAVLFGVGAAACYIPARRAMRVDPMVALKYE